jgi:hypothetical protein
MPQYGGSSTADFMPGAEQTVRVSGAVTTGSFAVAGGVGGIYPVQTTDPIMDILVLNGATGAITGVIPAANVTCKVAGYLTTTSDTSTNTLVVRFISSSYILAVG